MSQELRPLVILNTPVNQDDKGRFLLNDLWRISGKREQHKPSNYKDTSRAQSLAHQIIIGGYPHDPISAVRGGAAPGVYACREIVFDYCMWIDAAFNLTVIKGFEDYLQEGQGNSPRLPGPRDYSARALAEPLAPRDNHTGELTALPSVNTNKRPSNFGSAARALDTLVQKARAYDQIAAYLQGALPEEFRVNENYGDDDGES